MVYLFWFVGHIRPAMFALGVLEHAGGVFVSFTFLELTFWVRNHKIEVQKITCEGETLGPIMG